MIDALQAGLIRASLRNPDRGLYLIQDVCELPEPVQPEAFRKAWERVARRHPALRTGVAAQDGEVRLTVHDSPPPAWEVAPETDLALFLARDRARGFAFDGGVPLRFTLFGDRTLICSVHHALLDGRSLVLLWHELWQPDRAPAPPVERSAAPPAVPFSWKEYLRGLPPAGEFLVDRWRPGAPPEPGEVGRVSERLSAEDSARLREWATGHGLTLNSLLLAAWSLLLSRYSGQPEVGFGVIRTGRNAAEAEVAGLLMRSVPFRVATPPDAALLPWLKELRVHWLEQRACERTPVDVPPFDTLVHYDHEAPIDTLRRLDPMWERCSLRRLQRTDTPLTLAAVGSPVLTLDLIYQTRSFCRPAMAAAAVHLRTLLQAFPAAADAPLRSLRIVQPPEVPVAAEHASDLCAHELVERQVARTPDKIALDDRSGSLTYGELNRRANRLAEFLTSRGAGPEDVVAIHLANGPDAVVAVLGILKCGAAFLPIDQALPAAPLAEALRHAAPKFVLAGDPAAPGLDAAGCPVLPFAGEPGGPDQNPPPRATAGNAAYAIFTSGSTGTPKAIVNTHRALVNHTLAACPVFGITQTDRRLQTASPGSDPFISAVFNYLSTGATLVFPPQRHYSLKEYLRLIEEQRITITGIPATWWHEWVTVLGAGECAPPACLRAVITGMENVNPSDLRLWKEKAGARIRWFNAYGPAEASPISTIYEAGASRWECEAFVPIGKPLANTYAYVLDADGNLAPDGVPGELWVGGAGVGRGYLHAPELTARRFLADPFHPQRRVYRTGDLVFRLPDGNLVFAGRVDRQVKIRGYRVEPEAIEAALERHPRVLRAAVTLRKERLVAWVSARGEGAPGKAELRQYLLRTLPDYMAPSAIVVLDELPLTTGGKIDRQRLANTDIPAPGAGEEFQAPLTRMETRLAELWKEALGSTEIDVAADFFASGGDSLRATHLLALIDRRLGRELPLSVLWRLPTIARLAAFLERGAPAEPAAKGGRSPFFCISSSSGDAPAFRHIAGYLSTHQPFVVIPNPVQVGERLRTVEELARGICEAIRAAALEGPLTIGGYCFGGLLAYEAAQQLIAAGERVRMVILMDTVTPGYPKLLRSRGRYAANLWNATAWRAAGRHLGYLAGLLKRRAIARTQRDLMQMGVAPPAGATETEVSRQAATIYRPRPIAAPVVQLLAADRVETRVLEDPRLGWLDFCPAGFEARRLGTLHTNLLEPEAAKEMASALESLLAGD